MRSIFCQIPRQVFLLLAGLLLAGLVACSGDNSQAPVEPTLDRPTFVWIFSDP
ncbi:MAG TPA: hypothetical protein VF177_01140 [Anaerolineae bacterium]